MKPNHFAQHKPVVVLLETVDADGETQLQKLVDDAGETMVFKNLVKARKHVQWHIDVSLHSQIRFVNEKPEYGAGDREETHNRKCVKCGTFLRPSLNTQRMVMPDGSQVELDEYDCPACDLGEDPNARLH